MTRFRRHKTTLLLIYIALMVTAAVALQLGLGDNLHDCVFG